MNTRRMFLAASLAAALPALGLAGDAKTAAAPKTPLQVTPVTPDKDGPLRFAFDVSLGVRKKDHELRDQLDMFVTNHRNEINGILDGYNVPRVAPEAQLTSAK